MQRYTSTFRGRNSRSPSGSSGGRSSNGSDGLRRYDNSFGNRDGRGRSNYTSSSSRGSSQFRGNGGRSNRIGSSAGDDYHNSELENWDAEPVQVESRRNGSANGHLDMKRVSLHSREPSPIQCRRAVNRLPNRSPSPKYPQRRTRNYSPASRVPQRISRSRSRSHSPPSSRYTQRSRSRSSSPFGRRHSPSPIRQRSRSPFQPRRPRSPSPLKARRPVSSQSPPPYRQASVYVPPPRRPQRAYNTEDENWEAEPTAKSVPTNHTNGRAHIIEHKPNRPKSPAFVSHHASGCKKPSNSVLNNEDEDWESPVVKAEPLKKSPDACDKVLGIKIKIEKDEDTSTKFTVETNSTGFIPHIKTEVPEKEPGEASPSPPPSISPRQHPMPRYASFSPPAVRRPDRNLSSMSTHSSSSSSSRGPLRCSFSPEPLVPRTVRKRANDVFDPAHSKDEQYPKFRESKNRDRSPPDNDRRTFKDKRGVSNYKKTGTFGFDVNVESPEAEDPDACAVLLPPPPPIPLDVPAQTLLALAQAQLNPTQQFGNTTVPGVGLGPLGLLPHQIATFLPHQLALLAQLIQPLPLQMHQMTEGSTTSGIQIPLAVSPTSSTHSDMANGHRISGYDHFQGRNNGGSIASDEGVDENGELIPHRVSSKSTESNDADENWEADVPVRNTFSKTTDERFGFSQNPVFPTDPLIFDYGHGTHTTGFS